MDKPTDHAFRMERAQVALEGLSTGDAFGERFFVNPELARLTIEARSLPPPPWRYTDDTEMALGVVQVLEEQGHIDQNRLAQLFGARYRNNRHRGYGATAHDILQKINLGIPWNVASSEVFEGTGSMGNGGAMRAAPVGAYFADDVERLVAQARASAEVTHFHPDGQAGAIAVAAAAAAAAAWRWRAEPSKRFRLMEFVLDLTPEGDTRTGIEKALAWPLDATPTSAARALGNGQRVIASDTVPFCLWCAERHLGDYQNALWATVAGLGDRDTTCAIVGGIVALSGDIQDIPASWRSAREPLSARV